MRLGLNGCWNRTYLVRCPTSAMPRMLVSRRLPVCLSGFMGLGISVPEIHHDKCGAAFVMPLFLRFFSRSILSC